MSNTAMFRESVSKMMDSVTLDAKGNLKVLDEKKMAEAEELLNQMVVETSRNWWAQLESAEDSLADMSDEISFADMSADTSHVNTPRVPGKAKPAAAAPAAPTLESMLKGKDFDFSSIFEGAGFPMEDDGAEDFGPADGDEEFDDLQSGNDPEGLGDAGPMDDDGDDGDLDAIGDDGMGDDMGGDDDLGADLGDGEFDFSFLDDDGAEDDLGDDGAMDDEGYAMDDDSVDADAFDAEVDPADDDEEIDNF